MLQTAPPRGHRALLPPSWPGKPAAATRWGRDGGRGQNHRAWALLGRPSPPQHLCCSAPRIPSHPNTPAAQHPEFPATATPTHHPNTPAAQHPEFPATTTSLQLSTPNSQLLQHPCSPATRIPSRRSTPVSRHPKFPATTTPQHPSTLNSQPQKHPSIPAAAVLQAPVHPRHTPAFSAPASAQHSTPLPARVSSPLPAPGHTMQGCSKSSLLTSGHRRLTRQELPNRSEVGSTTPCRLVKSFSVSPSKFPHSPATRPWYRGSSFTYTRVPGGEREVGSGVCWGEG
uniref:Uncharacterized protein n=1 Tax=Chelonoidis abingdonii TaxID=106734 RepID=A0A8C0GXW8_CHEAB